MSSTIAAIATPQAAGGIGIVRISGGGAIETADRVFACVSGGKLSDSEGYRAHYGHVVQNGEVIDEAIALVFRAPSSYTGEDVVELSCHGGLYIMRRVLRAVLENGARMAEAGEFTRRAFENGKMSLVQAESVMDIIGAQGEQAARAAISAREGRLSGRIDDIRRKLTDSAAHLAAWADYPEEDLVPVDRGQLQLELEQRIAELQRLIEDGDAGKVMREGVSTAIVGKPNVGKSTLMNCLSGCERSIVTQIAGTTRDVVEERVSLGGIILRLADTAGIRRTDDPVESIGVEMAINRMDLAELVIAVFDNSLPLDENDMQLLQKLRGRRCVAVVNKNDVDGELDVSEIEKYISRVVCISAKNNSGVEELSREVSELLGVSGLNPADGILSGERQLDCARRCLASVTEAKNCLDSGVTLDAVNVLLDEAIDALLELVGEKATDVVTDAVFHNFCVGK